MPEEAPQLAVESFGLSIAIPTTKISPGVNSLAARLFLSSPRPSLGFLLYNSTPRPAYRCVVWANVDSMAECMLKWTWIVVPSREVPCASCGACGGGVGTRVFGAEDSKIRL